MSEAAPKPARSVATAVADGVRMAPTRPIQHLLRLAIYACATWTGHKLTKGQAGAMETTLPLVVSVLLYGADWAIHKITYSPLKDEVRKLRDHLFGDPGQQLKPGDAVANVPEVKATVVPAKTIQAAQSPAPVPPPPPRRPHMTVRQVP